jgi:probable phosphoglycerate mutase
MPPAGKSSKGELLANRITLVRHGETDWNKEKRIQGGLSNTPLNDLGRKQAEKLALRFRQDDIRAVYSSPLDRSLDTARAVARYHWLEVYIEPSLREIEAGELEGMATSDMGRRLSELLTQHGVATRLPGGESLTEVQQRSWEAVRRLSRQHPDGVLVLVSHYFVILTIVCSVLGLPLSQLGRFRMGNGGISIINLDGRMPWLELFNDTSYLVG